MTNIGVLAHCVDCGCQQFKLAPKRTAEHSTLTTCPHCWGVANVPLTITRCSCGQKIRHCSCATGPYDPNAGDDRLCQCGHPYFRHFDTYEEMAPVGCKYCTCTRFREKRS